jgi:hypothetical protein
MRRTGKKQNVRTIVPKMRLNVAICFSHVAQNRRRTLEGSESKDSLLMALNRHGKQEDPVTG